MTILLATVALIAPVHRPCESSGCVERVAAKRCSQVHVRSCVHRASLRWYVSYPMLMRKAWCESRLNPLAVNGSSNATGLFQFLPSTWWTTPYGRRPIFSAKWNALAAAWMHHVGRGSEWSCV